MTDYNGLYNKLTKKELIYTLIARDAMLKDCRERFELHKNTDAKTIQDQSDLIEELKAQIAESESKRKGLEEKVKFLTEEKEENFVDGQKYNELKQQLEKLKSENHALISDNAYQEADIFELTQKLAIQEQDKISFAVKQLEKVKEIISFKPPMQTYEEIIKTFMFRIDNQIKQLKEGK